MMKSYRHKRIRLQICMFTLCYISYANVHIFREFWSQSKPVIEDHPEKYHCSKSTLSDVDTVNSLIYGLTTFASGALGDAFDLRTLLPLSFFFQVLVFAAITTTGFVGGDLAYIQFGTWFALLGCAQSIFHPSLVSIVANWFPQRRRGLALAAFCTCTNVGNIIGAQVGAALLGAFNDNWQWLFVCESVLTLLVATALRMFLVPEPKEIGIMLEDEEIEARAAQELAKILDSSSATADGKLLNSSRLGTTTSATQSGKSTEKGSPEKQERVFTAEEAAANAKVGEHI